MAALHRPALPFPTPFARLRSGKLAIALIIALVIGVALAQVQQFSQLTSTGYEIDALKRERAAKQAQNHELEAEVAQLSSLARVDWEARTRLGMQPAKRTLYIEVNATAPEQQTLPTRFRPAQPAQAPGPEPDDERSVWERARGLLPF